jgi:FMN-dependent NADH-azoreductase
MKVLVYNGSPRTKAGITDKITQWFLEGAKDAGADTETVYLAKHKISYCTGCFNCWFVSPGKCIQKDDMRLMRDKYRDSDIIVFASPVYVDGFTAQTKTLLDRFIAGGSPFVEYRDGHTRHLHAGKGTKIRKLALISTCGFGERDNFDPMIMHMKAITKNFPKSEYIGALTLPMGGSMDLLKDEQPDLIEARKNMFHTAGIEAVQDGKISIELQNSISVPFISAKEYIGRLNKVFKGLREQRKK